MPRMVIRTIVESLSLSASKAEAGLSLGYAVDPAVLVAAHARADATMAAMRVPSTAGACLVDSLTPEAAAAFEAGLRPWSPPLRARGWKWRR
jgi:hypothetical protein